MNKTLVEILKSREDISDYVFHFSKGPKAFKILEKIIEDDAIKDISNIGHICFSEAPLTSLVEMFNLFNRYPNPMYAPYGIAIKKDYLHSLGGRHVFYGSKEDKDLLPEEIQWRFEEYIPKVKDFSWLREWRIKSEEVKLNSENCFIITKNNLELEPLTFPEWNNDIEFDGCVSDGQFMGQASLVIARNIKGISIEDLKSLGKMSKKDLETSLNEQNFYQTIDIPLGGFIQ